MLFLGGHSFAQPGNEWPAISSQNRPWARWWWLGSAVDEKNLRELLKQYHDAGFGGVEICPIYGARGYEDRYIQFLSPQWMKMLAVTTETARKLGMGVDLTDGTGWPNGGPNVSLADASERVILQKYEIDRAVNWRAELPKGKAVCIMAVSGQQRIDLTKMVRAGQITWDAPAGKWTVCALVVKQGIQKVKRAAPGGEGLVLDPFSPSAMRDYLKRFSKAFEGFDAPMPRAHFHDSYEYYGASWTPDLFDQFQKRRGYDLRTELPALFGDGNADTVSRVQCDYRQTISDLHLAYIQTWTQWAHSEHGLSREQAHGSPTNLLDTYAASDIPETEVEWRTPIEQQVPMLKFSSSAAHVTGKSLASSETFTWAGEHFQVSLDSLKPIADFLFCTGVNHIFFHGIPYSPEDVKWPGWQFYAAVNFGPEGGLWHDLPGLTQYIARCQSFLQRGKPDNDVLLYFPVYDIWQRRGDELVMQFKTPGKWMWDQPFYTLANELWKKGFLFDEVSDQLLSSAHVESGRIVLGGNAYQAIVVPTCELMPAETAMKLAELAQDGCKIVFEKSLPRDVPGLGKLAKRQKEFHAAIGDLRAAKVTSDLEKTLGELGVQRESMTDQGLICARRIDNDDAIYFVTNRSNTAIDGWVPFAIDLRASERFSDFSPSLGTPGEGRGGGNLELRTQNLELKNPPHPTPPPEYQGRERLAGDGVSATAEIFDPISGESGLAATRPMQIGSNVYLQLASGRSCIVCFSEHPTTDKAWQYWQVMDSGATELHGNWQAKFIQGEPKLPAKFSTSKLASWTIVGDANAKRFAGTARYTLHFEKPATTADDWVLDLGKVCESARVRLNGHNMGILWCKPFAIHVGKYLHDASNTLEVEVTNLAANAIADLDRRGVQWKAFHEINFVNREYEPFDASHWPVRDSGLIGPVRLVPLKQIEVGR